MNRRVESWYDDRVPADHCSRRRQLDHITPIDADDARQYALDEIDGGEAKAKAHQEELPSDATINR